ncbi:hypothetical protein [Mycolicibacterium sphagni]|uniref:hypothetical protein n=1 Tax=Mycolicibacterium sphagni TaxID=1786 RepID=UPI0021F3391D|nr:hypothetical protein [Mycolicibacterium sphagni]MCV7174912.1 hypothetical protein [Mycolicibacterium sphagni]
MDPIIAQAKEAHRAVTDHGILVGRHRRRRDQLIVRAYKTGAFSYGQLAKQIGCSPELIAKVIQGRR